MSCELMEIWKDVNGYEKLYQVSNLGRVKRFETQCVLKPDIRKGYCRVTIYKNSTKKNVSVHRLVAIAFINNPNNYMCINHKDELKENNNANNLEWCTQQYNINYGTRSKRAASTNSIPVIQKTLCGEIVKVFSSALQAQQETKIDKRRISDCVRGNKKTAGGFVWVFVYPERQL